MYNIIYICYNIFVRVHPAIVNIIGYPIFFFRIIIRNPVIIIRVNDLGYWEFFGLYFKRLKSWLYYYGNADSLDGKFDLSSSLFLCFDFLVQ